MAAATAPAVANTRRHPPGPKGHFILGAARDFQRDPLGQMVQLWRVYGDAIRVHFFAGLYGYLFYHPDHLKHILQDNNRNYTKNHPNLLIVRPILGNGLVTSDGEFWRRQRRLAQPAFHRQRIAGFSQIMGAAAEHVAADWRAPARDGHVLDVNQEMMRLTLAITGKTLFSMDLTAEAEAVGRAFTFASEYVGQNNARPFAPYLMKLPTPGARRFRAAVAELDAVVHKIIQERRRSGQDHGDLLSMLMLTRDEETGATMDDRQLRDEVMTLLLAGHETTSNALTWTWYLLSQHQEVEEKLHAELDGVLGDRPAQIDDLARLIYTRMVIEEAMRLYPPAYALARGGVDEDEIGGYHVTARAVVTLSPYVTHRHPDFWPQPEKFDPERFTPELSAERPRYAYLPFGGGPRQCIGNTFAMTEAQLILATLAQRYRLRLAAGHRVEMEPLITLRLKGGLPMTVQARS